MRILIRVLVSLFCLIPTAFILITLPAVGKLDTLPIFIRGAVIISIFYHVLFVVSQTTDWVHYKLNQIFKDKE